jgi:multiple sugar transport system substrate-binding protein
LTSSEVSPSQGEGFPPQLSFVAARSFRHRPGVALLIGLVVLFVLLATGVTAVASASLAPINVRLLTPSPFVAALADSVDAFERSHPRIRIQLVGGPLDTEQISDLAISSLLLGDTPYDLLMVDVSWLPRYAAAGWLEPLEPWFGPDQVAAIEPGAQLGNSIGGHLWRMPLTGDTGLLYWRTDLMAAPPKTMEELVAISRRLQRQGKVRWGYVWQGRQYEGLSCFFLEVLEGFGGHWWRPDGGVAVKVEARRAGNPGPPARIQQPPGADPRPVGSGVATTIAIGQTELSSPAAVRAATFLDALVRSGVTPGAVASFAENEALQLFAAGDAAFLRNWPYAWREIERSGGPASGHVGVVPVVAASGHQSGGTLGTWGLSMLKGTPHPQEAAAVLAWLTGPETQRQLVLNEGYAPTWTSLYEDADLGKRQPLLAIQRQALAHAVLRPPSALYSQLSDVLQRQVNGLISGRGNPDEAMREAQRQSQAVLRAASGEPG